MLGIGQRLHDERHPQRIVKIARDRHRHEGKRVVAQGGEIHPTCRASSHRIEGCRYVLGWAEKRRARSLLWLSMSCQGSPIWTRRWGTVRMLKLSGSAFSSSDHWIGTETPAQGVGRREY